MPRTHMPQAITPHTSLPRLRARSEPDEIAPTLTVDGVATQLKVAPSTMLVDALRNHLDLAGTKNGMHGQCGACTVLMDGWRCLALALMNDGAEMTTIEGLAADGALRPLQQPHINHDAFRCGCCTPGQIRWAVGIAKAGRRTRTKSTNSRAATAADAALIPTSLRRSSR